MPAEDKESCAALCDKLKLARDRCSVVGSDADGLLACVPKAQADMLTLATTFRLSSVINPVSAAGEYSNVTGEEFHYHTKCRDVLDKVVTSVLRVGSGGGGGSSRGDAGILLASVTDWCQPQVSLFHVLAWQSVHDQVCLKLGDTRSTLKRTTEARLALAKHWNATLLGDPLVIVTEGGPHYVKKSSTQWNPFAMMRKMSEAEQRRKMAVLKEAGLVLRQALQDGHAEKSNGWN
jgi:hypothetical protein